VHERTWLIVVLIISGHPVFSAPNRVTDTASSSSTGCPFNHCHCLEITE